MWHDIIEVINYFKNDAVGTYADWKETKEFLGLEKVLAKEGQGLAKEGFLEQLYLSWQNSLTIRWPGENYVFPFDIAEPPRF